MGRTQSSTESENKLSWSNRIKITTIVGAGIFGFAAASHSGFSPEKAFMMGVGASLSMAGLFFLAYIAS